MPQTEVEQQELSHSPAAPEAEGVPPGSDRLALCGRYSVELKGSSFAYPGGAPSCPSAPIPSGASASVPTFFSF